MIYKFDVYMAEHPTKYFSTLKKFINEPKNLHEMETAEINEIIASWGSVASGSATNYKSEIKLYLNWLAENGVDVKANPQDIVVPVKAAEYFIYSSENLHEYWEKYLASCEREATKTGEYHSRARYLTSYAAHILSFYGLTVEQIIALNIDDVQADGVVGYDLPLTQKDIEVLLEYKHLSEFANNKKMKGEKYIRSTTGVVKKETLDYSVTRGACGEDIKYLKRILTCYNLYKLGRFAEIYMTEKRDGELVDLSYRAIPADWFIEQIGLIIGNEVSSQSLTLYKKCYKTYRAERMAYEAKHNVQPTPVVKGTVVVEQKPDVSELLEALKIVDAAIAEANKMKAKADKMKAEADKMKADADRMKVNLLGIKAQIRKFVK